MSTESVPALTLTPADVVDLADALRPYHAIYGSFFSRSESRTWAERYLHGLLSPLPRKSVEPMVIAQLGADEKAIRGMQQFLTDSTWDDATILRRHWREVAQDLDDAEGMLIADGSDFAKKGQHSVGVKRQYCGELGKIATCQAGVFLAYASPHGATLLDRRLYLPQEWLEDPAFAERRAKCRIPAEVTFQTKNELTLAMVQAVVASQLCGVAGSWPTKPLAAIRGCWMRWMAWGCGTWWRCHWIPPSGWTTARPPRPRRPCSARWRAALGAGI